MAGRRPTAALLALAALGIAPAAGQGLFGGLRGPEAAGDAKQQLAAAYPGAFRIDGGTLVFADGTRVVWDDGARKSPERLLTDADVEDMFAYRYPRAVEGPLVPGRDEDPGRVRSEAFFHALYGGSEAAVRRSLARVAWIGGSGITVTKRFGVDRALGRVRDALKRRADLAPYLAPPGGGFNWRPIAGTDRLSVHSFGAAVDIATAQTDYWLWAASTAGTIPYRNQIPMDVVAAFEAECFIWGGRWYHYDTMHFEYRPELLPGCRRGDQ